eukprot:jgi/Psemu1/20239/gm1.20239_g
MDWNNGPEQHRIEGIIDSKALLTRRQHQLKGNTESKATPNRRQHRLKGNTKSKATTTGTSTPNGAATSCGCSSPSAAPEDRNPSHQHEDPPLPETAGRIVSALKRGPHQSLHQGIGFLRDKYTNMMDKQQWTVLPTTHLLQDLPGLRLGPLGLVVSGLQQVYPSVHVQDRPLQLVLPTPVKSEDTMKLAKSSSPNFCACTKTIAELANAALATEPAQPRSQPHRLDLFAEVPSADTGRIWHNRQCLAESTTCYKKPLRYWDVYVYDFCGLAQGDQWTGRAIKHVLLQSLEKVFRPLGTLDMKFRQELASRKKMLKGDATWTSNKAILDWPDWKYYQPGLSRPPNIFNNQPTTGTMPKKRRTAGDDETSRPSPRAVPRVNYEEVPTDDEEEYAYVDPEAYTELPAARVATSYKRIRQSIALIFEHALETPPAEDWKELNTISFISETVADSIESGNSVRMSTVIVNKYRKKLELPSFTYSAVRGYGEEGETRFQNQGGCLVLCFIPLDVALLSPLKLSQIVWFDKIHKQCHIGQSGSRIGPGRPNLDPNGEYAASDKSVLQVKYKHEAWFCLGVFMTDDDKVIAYAKTRKGEIHFNRIALLLNLQLLTVVWSGFVVIISGIPSKVWICNDQPPGAIYRNESVQQIPKLKGKMFEKLQQHGLVLVRDLKALSSKPDRIRTIAAATPGISFNRLSGFAHAAAICLEGDPPPVFDHCQADNPYESLYGRSWEEEVDKVCMAGKVCVTEMIDYMFDQTNRIFGDEGFVYHDALVLMTCADSFSYMKGKGYYKHWIFPELDLMGEQGGVGGSLKLYRNRPVGNRSEANPLDTSLFSQLNRAVDQHDVLTQGFIDENKKFSLATPTAVSRTYCRVWTLHPKSETIVKDINKVLRSFLEVAEAEGIPIDGIGDRSERRHLPRGQHEGRGVQKLDIDCYDKGEIELHEDAEDAGDLILAKAEAKFNLNELIWKTRHCMVILKQTGNNRDFQLFGDIFRITRQCLVFEINSCKNCHSRNGGNLSKIEVLAKEGCNHLHQASDLSSEAPGNVSQDPQDLPWILCPFRAQTLCALALALSRRGCDSLSLSSTQSKRIHIGLNGFTTVCHKVSTPSSSLLQIQSSSTTRSLLKDSSSAQRLHDGQLTPKQLHRGAKLQANSPVPRLCQARPGSLLSKACPHHTGHAVVSMICIAFFFCLQPGEYTGTSRDNQAFHLEDTTFYLGPHALVTYISNGVLTLVKADTVTKSMGATALLQGKCDSNLGLTAKAVSWCVWAKQPNPGLGLAHHMEGLQKPTTGGSFPKPLQTL